MTMKIYLDDGFACEHGGGIAVYSDLLCSGLESRGVQVHRARYGKLLKIKSKLVRRLLYTVYLNFILPLRLIRDDYTIAHFTNNHAPRFGNRFTKYITTIHDLNPIIFPQTVPAIYHKYFTMMLHNVTRTADTIIAVSENTKKVSPKKKSMSVLKRYRRRK